MKILIPTDFSKNAVHAVAYAATIAKAIKAELVLLNVYTPPVTRASVAYPLITEEIGRMKKEAREKLEQLVADISENYGITCTYVVGMGDPVPEIISESENSAVDLIVMGTKGATGLEKILFGSNTAAVIEQATCPVMAIPATARIGVPGKIVFATDYQDNDLDTLKALSKFISAFGAELTILHVSKEKLKSDRDMIEDFSKAVAKETGISQPYYYVLAHENTQEGIEEFMESSQADLLVLSTRKRGMFEKLFGSSTTQQLSYHAHSPILAFHVLPAKGGSDL